MIDTILGKVKSGLDGIKDHSMQSGNLQHTLGDTLMSAFPMFHLKDPSLLVFRQRLDERWSNMERVYKIQSVPRKNLFEKVRQVFDLSPCMSTNVV